MATALIAKSIASIVAPALLAGDRDVDRSIRRKSTLHCFSATPELLVKP